MRHILGDVGAVAIRLQSEMVHRRSTRKSPHGWPDDSQQANGMGSLHEDKGREYDAKGH